VLIAFGAMAIALLLGMPLALGNQRARMVKLAVTIYIEFFRGTPVLVRCYFFTSGLRPLDWHARLADCPDRSGPQFAWYECRFMRALEAIPRDSGSVPISWE